MRLRGLIALTLGLLWAGGLTGQTQMKTADPGQLFTAGDERFDRSVPIPKDVVKLLLRTAEAKYALGLATDREQRELEQSFLAVKVHLSESNETALLVLGVGPMHGADNAWFWIVLSPSVRPKIALFATGESVELMNSRTRNHVDIRSRWSSPRDTCTRIYHFNGQRYRLWKEEWTQNSDNDSVGVISP